MTELGLIILIGLVLLLTDNRPSALGKGAG